ncbi:Outer membrane porin F [Acidipropionibacterium virtanenii]|uniref:Outer membrane porin F n=2 Tax=Acidipropionibacterium virtanenii TaxID=2057246 RepID=A0A344URF1_9ACTN|nr:Outer membrane porin F [Acidipropionibacterium virtanenii]
MTVHFHSRRIKAAFTLAIGLGLAASAVPATARADDGAIPVQGQLRLSPQKQGVKGKAVLSLHSVNAVDGATTVFYSLALTKDSPAQYGSHANGHDYASRLGNGHYTEPNLVAGANDGAVIDPKGSKIYLPLISGKYCVACSAQAYKSMFNLTPGLATIGWFTVPKLPSGVTTVDVSVANHLFTGVKITSGAPTPTAAVPQFDPLYLGQGWPAIDAASVAKVNQSLFIKDVVATSEAQGDSGRERKTAGESRLDLDSEVLFAKDSDVVKPAGKTQILAAAKKITAMRPSGPVLVTGYTDNLGSAAHGLDLSKRRAAAVTKILQPQLPAGTKVVSQGKGEADPVATNDTESGRQLNRRVTITVKES